MNSLICIKIKRVSMRNISILYIFEDLKNINVYREIGQCFFPFGNIDLDLVFFIRFVVYGLCHALVLHSFFFYNLRETWQQYKGWVSTRKLSRNIWNGGGGSLEYDVSCHANYKYDDNLYYSLSVKKKHYLSLKDSNAEPM